MASAAATIGLGLRTGEPTDAPALNGPPLRVLTTLSDREVFFGDAVEARLEVVLDTRKLSASRVRVGTGFAPYRVALRTVRREQLGGGFSRIVYRYRLRCLGATCPPQPGSHRVFRFRPALVTAGTRRARALWPPLVVASRIYGVPEIRADDLRGLPALDGSPDRRATGFLLASGALGLAAVAFVGWRVGARRRRALLAPIASGEPPAPDPVASACARLRARLSGPVSERGALDNLSRALAQAGDQRRAAEVRALAWRRDRPSEAELERVLHAIERSFRVPDAA